VTRELLLDTGALVSLLDRGQTRHEAFVRYFEEWEGAVVSTEAVLTEATHLLSRVPGGAAACLEFYLRGGATLIPTGKAALERCRDLMAKYSDLPMDYADATLVVLGEELGAELMLTTDRRDFSVYRTRTGGSFEVVP
jgi:predicted nucleic acid-binding protein